MKVCIIYERSESGGWGAFPPAIPGVGAVGKTYEEVRDRIKTAIEWHIEDMSTEELDIPEATAVAVELMDVAGPRGADALKKPA
jgi:predicted RNase H-like HicB family nuclease